MVFKKENIIQLPGITEDTAKKIAQIANKNWDEIEFNNTVGSIFMPIGIISQLFLAIPDEKIHLKHILITCHLLHKCGIFKEKKPFF